MFSFLFFVINKLDEEKFDILINIKYYLNKKKLTRAMHTPTCEKFMHHSSST
jgi:hypothetical protein